MDKLADHPKPEQVVITRDDLVQFLYPLRAALERIARTLDGISAKLDTMQRRRAAQVIPLKRPAALGKRQ